MNYDLHWVHVETGRHCPNLVPTLREKLYVNGVDANATTYRVTANIQQSQGRIHDEYESLADVWTTWNRE